MSRGVKLAAYFTRRLPPDPTLATPVPGGRPWSVVRTAGERRSGFVKMLDSGFLLVNIDFSVGAVLAGALRWGWGGAGRGGPRCGAAVAAVVVGACDEVAAVFGFA